MTTVEATEVGKHFEEVLERVKNGEQVVVTENGVAVAQIAPAPVQRETDEEKLARLERAGVITRNGTGQVARWIIDEPPPKTEDGSSIVEVLLEERRSGW